MCVIFAFSVFVQILYKLIDTGLGDPPALDVPRRAAFLTQERDQQSRICFVKQTIKALTVQVKCLDYTTSMAF